MRVHSGSATLNLSKQQGQKSKEYASNWDETKGSGTACDPMVGKVTSPGQKLFLVGAGAVGINITGNS